MAADALCASFVEADGREFLARRQRSRGIFLRVNIAWNVVFGGLLSSSKSDVDDAVHSRVFARYEQISNSSISLWPLYRFLNADQPQERINADQANIPRVARSTNLSF